MDDFKELALKTGERLAYAEYGATTGTPVLFFHGWPSSRTMGELTDSAARGLNIRVISADRPGICDSSFQPNRTLLDWPDVVEQLADELGIKRFHILFGRRALRLCRRIKNAGSRSGGRNCQRRGAVYRPD
jgi:pimeloyl-ACP methyl ester carboxylesterase